MSGHNKQRDGLWAAIAALKRGYVLVVRWHHRLAKDTQLAHYIRRSVRAKGATIEAVEGVNGEDPASMMQRKILEAFDEYERKMTCERTSAGMLRNQRNGQRMSAKVPYGTSRDPDDKARLVENEAEQAVIERILALRADGLNYHAICRQLDADGTKPRSKKWRHSQSCSARHVRDGLPRGFAPHRTPSRHTLLALGA